MVDKAYGIVYVFIGWNNHIPLKRPWPIFDISGSTVITGSPYPLSLLFLWSLKYVFAIFGCKGYCTPLKIKMSLKMGHFKREKSLASIIYQGLCWLSGEHMSLQKRLIQNVFDSPKEKLGGCSDYRHPKNLPCHDVMETPDPPNDNAKALQSQKSPGHLLRCWGLAIFLPFRTPEK